MALIPHLQLIQRAIDAGFRPSSVVGADESSLQTLLAQAPATGQPASSGAEAERELDGWLEQLERLDGDGLERGFRRAWSAWGARSFVLDLALPFMQEVGRRWSRKHLVVMHEHFASELLRGFLAQQVRALSQLASGPRIICAALPGERHSLGLQMAAVLLTLADFDVLFLGADTPVDQVLGATAAGGVQAVVVSSSQAADTNTITESVDELRRRLPAELPLVVGGQSLTRTVDGVTWLASLHALEQWAAGLPA